VLDLQSLIVVFFFFYLGAIIASFVGVIVERINTGTSWVSGRSRCDSCGRTLRSFELIPIISWVAALGHCGMCGSLISWRSTISEFVLGVFFGAAYISLGLSLALIAFLVALSCLLAIVLYDLRHMLVPREFFLPFVASALVFSVLIAASTKELGSTLLIAAAIGLAFVALYFFSGGRAMGLGDAPVAFGLALLVGGSAIAGLIFSFWIGAVIGILLLVLMPHTRRMGVEVPFVPFLAAGFLLAYFTTWDPFIIIASLMLG